MTAFKQLLTLLLHFFKLSFKTNTYNRNVCMYETKTIASLHSMTVRVQQSVDLVDGPCKGPTIEKA